MACGLFAAAVPVPTVAAVAAVAAPAWGTRLPELDIALADASAPTGLWSDGETVWVSDVGEGVLAYALSDGSRRPGRDIDVAAVSRPSGLWCDGATMMVADYDGGVRAYRLSDGSRLSNQDLNADVLATAGNDNPVGLWSDGANLLVADNADGRVYAYALSDGRRVRRAEFRLKGADVPTVQPLGLWSDGETVLASHWTPGSVRGYRLSDGARRSARDINAQKRGNSYPRGLWSDGQTLWVVDYEDRKLYAYAVPGLVQQPSTADESMARLTALSLDGIDIGRFSGLAYDYVGAVSEGVTRTTLAATPIEGASLSVSPPDAASDTPGHQIVMGQDVQQLTVVVTVTSADGLTAREYRVALHRAVVRFADANLGAAVASALGKDSASPLVAADLARLQTLDLGRVKVGDLGGLEFAANLHELFLGANRVADLSPLEGLSVRVRHALTPGLGDLVWTADDVWDPIGALGGSEYRTLGYGMVFMADGYLVTISAADVKQRAPWDESIVEVWDVSDPTRPERVTVYRNEDTHRLRQAHSVGLWNRAGRIVLVAQTYDGVAFFDVTEIRTRLTLLAELPIAGVEQGDYAGAWWVGVQAPYVYVAAVGGGLVVVDALDPSAPRVARHVPTGRLGGISPGSVFPVGNLLVVAEPGNRGYATMDISDPTNPALIEARDGASGYSHLFTAGLLLTSGNVVGRTVRPSSSTAPGDVRGEPNRMYVHRVTHDGHVSYVGEAGEGLGRGGYGAYQDGYFFGGFSDRVAKFTIDPPALVGSGTSVWPGRDEDFVQPLGNLVFAGNDHKGPSALIPHQAEPDERGPEVVWMHPADGATGVAATSRVGVSMSDQVAVESLVATNFRVRPRGGESVSGQLSVNLNNMNFSPDAPLAEDTVYEVDVCHVADLVGNPGGCTASTFTTAASGAAAPSCSVGLLAPAVTGTEVSYDAVSVGVPTSYEWSFGDGQRIGPQESGEAAVTHAAPGRYSATLTVSNEHGTGSCSGVRVVHAAVTANAPAASSSIVVKGSESEWQEPGDVEAKIVDSDVYVANPDAGTVTRLDNEHARVWETAVGETPRTLAIAPNDDIWVAVEGDGDIVVLNRAGELVRRIDLGYGAAPHGIVFAPDGGSAYVTLGGSGRLLRLSPSGTTTGSNELGGQPRGIAVSADSQRIFVTRFVSAFAESGAKGEIYEVDAASFTLTRTHELAFDAGPDTESSGRGAPNYLSQARIAPDGATLWAPSKKDNIARGTLRDGQELDFETQTRAIASQVDLTTNTETLSRRIDFNDRDLAQSLVFTPLGDAFVVAFQGSNVIEVWDANALTRLSEVSVGRAPMGLAFRADGRRLYVHNFLDRSVTVLNTAGLLDGTVNQPVVVETVSTVAEEALAAEVLSGKRVFYNAADRRMNRDGYISCASCHLDGGSDGMVWDRTQFGEGLRNTIDLRGRRGTNGGFVHWTANFDEVQDFEHDMRDAFGGSGFMSEAEFRSGTRSVPLGDAKAGVNAELDALAAYVESLDRTPDSPHRAADGSLTAAGVAGRAVFDAKACARCHVGADFTDDGIHDVGTIRASSGAGLTGISTPTLKGLWLGAPYLHDGNASTLAEVLGNAVHMGAALTAEEKESLEAYLLQIDDSEPAPRVPTVTRPNPPVATIAVSASPAEIEEGQSATVTVAITNDVTFTEEQALALQVSGVSASDYSLAPEPLTLPAGSSSASATLSAVLDDLEEAAETAQIAVLLDGESVGSAAVTFTDAVPPPAPGIAGVPQVGGSLEATFEEAVPAEIRYQWLRGAGGDEISGAVGASYTAVEADEDEAVSVRVDLGNAAVAHTSAATAPVWPAASNPPLHGRDEELLGATMTLGSSDAFPLWLAGYGRFEGVAFGSMDRLSFSVGDVEHELTVAMVNAQGGFALQASPRIADVSGLVVYWNDYRIESLAPDNGSDPQFWVASTPQPKSEYGRYWRGASDGVQVALSIRRPGPEDDASLSGLTLSDVDIGAFDSEVTSYTAEVPFSVEMTTLEAVASDDRASIEIADSVGSTVGPLRTSRLAGGANEITVTVTAADQETTRTYAVTVTRLPPPWGTRLRSRDISLSGASTATGVWSDGSTMWVVADRIEGVVQGYSLADGSRLAERDLELVGGYGYTTALWSDGSTLWAADYYGGVLGYRLSDGARLADKDLDGAVLSAAGNDNPGGLWSDGTTLWVADHIDGWVYAYLLSDGSRVSAEEFSVRTQQHHGMSPFGLWFGDGTVLASYWARGLVMAYRESDGSHLGSRDIDTGSSGNDFPRGLWSDGSTLWVADEVDLKLYAYAVPVSVAASQVSVDPGPFGPIPPSWAPAVPSASPGPPVFVPDAGLRSRLEAALGKAPGESIGTREMAATEMLNLDGAAPDLWALIGLTGLKRLSLRGNDLEDLSALSLLAGLRVLDIGENRIVDLGPLAALTGLESLRADGNRIHDLNPLAGLLELRHLSLRANGVTDLSPLSGLPVLETLELGE